MPTAAAVPSASSFFAMTKQSLRERAKALRATLARAAPNFASHIAGYVANLPLPHNSTVAGYYPVRDESDPLKLMRVLAGRGHRLALPLMRPRSTLVFARWSFGDHTRLNRFGIMEPEEPEEIVTPDAILVPLLAFDAEGHRLGYGGGYYDRVLESSRAVTIGIAYKGQEVEKLPREKHDRSLDFVLTELGLRKFG